MSFDIAFSFRRGYGPLPTLRDIWIEIIDESTGAHSDDSCRVYYLNRFSKERKWESPFVDDEKRLTFAELELLSSEEMSPISILSVYGLAPIGEDILELQSALDGNDVDLSGMDISLFHESLLKLCLLSIATFTPKEWASAAEQFGNSLIVLLLSFLDDRVPVETRVLIVNILSKFGGISDRIQLSLVDKSILPFSTIINSVLALIDESLHGRKRTIMKWLNEGKISDAGSETEIPSPPLDMFTLSSCLAFGWITMLGICEGLSCQKVEPEAFVCEENVASIIAYVKVLLDLLSHKNLSPPQVNFIVHSISLANTFFHIALPVENDLLKKDTVLYLLQSALNRDSTLLQSLGGTLCNIVNGMAVTVAAELSHIMLNSTVSLHSTLSKLEDAEFVPDMTFNSNFFDSYSSVDFLEALMTTVDDDKLGIDLYFKDILIRSLSIMEEDIPSQRMNFLRFSKTVFLPLSCSSVLEFINSSLSYAPEGDEVHILVNYFQRISGWRVAEGNSPLSVALSNISLNEFQPKSWLYLSDAGVLADILVRMINEINISNVEVYTKDILNVLKKLLQVQRSNTTLSMIPLLFYFNQLSQQLTIPLLFLMTTMKSLFFLTNCTLWPNLHVQRYETILNSLVNHPMFPLHGFFDEYKEFEAESNNQLKEIGLCSIPMYVESIHKLLHDIYLNIVKIQQLFEDL